MKEKLLCLTGLTSLGFILNADLGILTLAILLASLLLFKKQFLGPIIRHLIKRLQLSCGKSISYYPIIALSIMLLVGGFSLFTTVTGQVDTTIGTETSIKQPGISEKNPGLALDEAKNEQAIKTERTESTPAASEVTKEKTQAEDQPLPIDSGDTTFILISAALVFIMTPGLALFYGGMVRRKNILGTLMHSFVAIGLVTIIWVLYGYSLSFAPDINNLIGNLDWVGLKGVGLEPSPDYASTIPHQAFMVFQLMFAIITPALITGAFAERFKFKTYILFLVIWMTLVYFPLAHWVWGGGWIGDMGALDFAGGLVVHISSGVAALACAIVVGKRSRVSGIAPHNLVITLIGAAILWLGWFGFNAGSALSAGSLAASAFVVTHIAAAAAAITWLFIEWIFKFRPTALGFASGAVAGLVAITPAAGFVDPLGAIVIGIGAGMLCFLAIHLKNKFGYDDTLDVVGVHGIGGTWGAIATGLLATTVVNADGANGLFYSGTTELLTKQLISVGAAWFYVFIVTIIILKVLDATLGLRIKEEDETIGLDLSQHGERGYTF